MRLRIETDAGQSVRGWPLFRMVGFMILVLMLWGGIAIMSIIGYWRCTLESRWDPVTGEERRCLADDGRWCERLHTETYQRCAHDLEEVGVLLMKRKGGAVVIILALLGGVGVLTILWLGVMVLFADPMHRHRWMDKGDEDADAAYSGRFPGH